MISSDMDRHGVVVHPMPADRNDLRHRGPKGGAGIAKGPTDPKIPGTSLDSSMYGYGIRETTPEAAQKDNTPSPAAPCPDSLSKRC